jgi:hypothetical protein
MYLLDELLAIATQRGLPFLMELARSRGEILKA